MFQKIFEGEKFKSLFTGVVFQVKEIRMNAVLLENVGNKNHQALTEMGAIIKFCEKVGD